VFWAFTMTNEETVAVFAARWKGIAFLAPELTLERGIDHFRERLFEDIAKIMGRINEVVAGIEVSVVFERHGGSTGFAEKAQAWVHAHPSFEADVKDLDKGGTDVPPDPFVKDGAEKFSVGKRPHGPGGDLGFKDVRGDQGETVFSGLQGGALYDWDELYKTAAHVAEKPVDFEGML